MSIPKRYRKSIHGYSTIAPRIEVHLQGEAKSDRVFADVTLGDSIGDDLLIKTALGERRVPSWVFIQAMERLTKPSPRGKE